MRLRDRAALARGLRRRRQPVTAPPLSVFLGLETSTAAHRYNFDLLTAARFRELIDQYGRIAAAGGDDAAVALWESHPMKKRARNRT
jgi:hypothetical protein